MYETDIENWNELIDKFMVCGKVGSWVSRKRTFFEQFDIMLYIHMAVLLNELFFPQTDQNVASLLSAFTFCSTFIFIPIGALIFGWVGDNTYP